MLAYAATHTTVAVILANTVAGDAPVLFALTCLIIYQLANLYGKDFSESLQNRLKDFNLSDAGQNVGSEMAELIDKYR